ncbi:hypothetical protein D3C71_1649390 [compost metagenome]
MSSAVSTSTGEVDSSTVRSTARVPVTITVSSVVAWLVAFWAKAGEDSASAMARPSGAEVGRDMGTPGRRGGGGERNAYIHPDEAIYYLRVNTWSVASPIGNQLMTMCDITSGAMDATVFPAFGGFP